jgi:hypothetical protein
MAMMGHIAWADSDLLPPSKAFESSSESSESSSELSWPAVSALPKIAQILEFAHVFRGRELTRKHDRIPCGIAQLDNLLEGGIVRGRINEIIAEPGAGKTSLAAAFAADVTRREAAAWIDTSDNFDPASIAAAGVDLTRLLWISSKGARKTQAEMPTPLAGEPAVRVSKFPMIAASLKAAEWILGAGGFGLVILDLGDNPSQLSQSAALRLARAAERSGAGVLIIAPRRICGTFAVLSLTLRRKRACFSHLWPDAPALFDGLLFEACLTRNKLGSSGQIAKWAAVSEIINGAERRRTYQWDELEEANESAGCTYKDKSATHIFNKNGSRIVAAHRLNPASRRSGKPRQANPRQA